MEERQSFTETNGVSDDGVAAAPARKKLHFKRNGGLILKTFLYQVVMSLFGIMMYGAVHKVALLDIVGSIIIIFFFHYIVFTQMYQGGYKNCEHDLAHKGTSFLWVGFLCSFLAFLPAILLSLWSVLAPPCLPDGTQTNMAPYLLNKTFLQGMYTSVLDRIFPTSAEFTPAQQASSILSLTKIYGFTAIPGILNGGIAYLLGYLNFKKNKTKK